MGELRDIGDEDRRAHAASQILDGDGQGQETEIVTGGRQVGEHQIRQAL